MKCEVLRKDGKSIIHNNIRGLSVEHMPGREGSLVLINHFTSDTGVERIPRWDWDRVLITKDFSSEKV